MEVKNNRMESCSIGCKCSSIGCGVAQQDRSVTQKDRSVAQQEGSVAPQDGSVTQQDWSAAQKDGSVALQDGSVQQDGAIFTFFRLSKMGTLLLLVYIFMSSFLKNQRILLCVHGKIFIFKKSLKMDIFLKLPEIFLLYKEQQSKIEFKIRICLVFFYFQK